LGNEFGCSPIGLWRKTRAERDEKNEKEPVKALARASKLAISYDFYVSWMEWDNKEKDITCIYITMRGYFCQWTRIRAS
jgi:L-lysine 2,3-aminomutase